LQGKDRKHIAQQVKHVALADVYCFCFTTVVREILTEVTVWARVENALDAK
jgi:hypothetical protein